MIEQTECDRVPELTTAAQLLALPCQTAEKTRACLYDYMQCYPLQGLTAAARRETAA